MKASLPLGVDILESKKAHAFFRLHRDRLDRLFSAAEKRFILGSKKPADAFAMLFCAKEAAFKATQSAWLSVHGFKRLSLVPKGAGQFFFRQGAGSPRLLVTIERTKRHWVALCRPAGL